MTLFITVLRFYYTKMSQSRKPKFVGFYFQSLLIATPGRNPLTPVMKFYYTKKFLYRKPFCKNFLSLFDTFSFPFSKFIYIRLRRFRKLFCKNFHKIIEFLVLIISFA